MPAASADKRARQRANKLLRSKTATESPELVSPPTQLAHSSPAILSSADELSAWPAPAPATFTISYTPLSISYPEPTDPTAKLETDAIRVTRVQLADMLHQSYIHGSEHGWKANVASAKERLQADYERDMEAATIQFAEHSKQINQEAFDHGFDYGINDCEAQLSKLQETLTAEYKKQHETTAANFSHCQQDFHEAGIQEERKRWESTRAAKVDLGIQVDETVRTFSEAASQTPHTPPPAILSPSSVSLPEDLNIPPSFPLSGPTLLSPDSPILIPDIEPTPPFSWSEEPSDVPNLLPLSSPPPSVPVFSTPLPIPDFSDLCSGANPWQSLQHRKGRDRQRFTQTIRQCKRQRPPHTTNFYSNIQRTHLPHILYPNIPYKPPPNPPAPLDWHTDPRLFELSQVLKTLGWVPPLTTRPWDRFP